MTTMRHGTEDGGSDRESGSVLHERANHLHTLNEISRVVSATLDLRTLYDTIYAQVGRVMDTTQFFIALHRPEHQIFEVAYHQEEGTLFIGQEIPLGQGLTSIVMREGLPYLFRNSDEFDAIVSRYDRAPTIIGDKDSQSGIFVPLNTGNRTIGAMTVQSPHANAYTFDDMQTLSVIAAQAAVAIENARLYERSQHAVRQMEALLHAAQTILGTLELNRVLDSILAVMREVMPYYFAAILLPDRSDEVLLVKSTLGPPEAEIASTMKVPFGQGITGTVFVTGEPLLCNDVVASPAYIGNGVPSVRSEVAVPLKRGDVVVGVLDVESDVPGAFSQEDQDVLSLFASQAAIAIENARLFSEQQSRVYELQTIQAIVRKLTPLHDVPAIARLINAELRHLIDYHACRVFIVDDQHDVLVPVLFEGSSDVAMRLKIGAGLAGWITECGRSEIIDNSLADSRVTHIPGTPERAESMIGAPLIYEGRVRGVITLSKLGVAQFDQNALRLLEIIAAQAAIAFDRVRLYDELRTEAITDDLTRLYNRRYLMDRLHEERSRAVRNEHTLVAMMLDIDRFKLVNDSYGHGAGDVVLRELAMIIRAVVRAEDIVARYGGEEFCVLLPEIPVDDAQIVAERLRDMIARHEMPRSAGISRITVSIGLAYLRTDEEEAQLFTRADAAMYAVKHTGGNRVCCEMDGGFRFVDGDLAAVDR